MRVVAAAAIVAASAVFAACGERAPQSVAAAKVTTTAPRASTPAQESGDSRSLERPNRSDRSTALGRMCWAAFEMSRNLGKFLTTTLEIDGKRSDEARASAVVDAFKRLLNDLPSALGSPAGLPPQANEFRNSLISAAQTASEQMSQLPANSSIEQRRGSYQTVLQTLRLGDLPGAADFESVAKLDPVACPELAAP